MTHVDQSLLGIDTLLRKEVPTIPLAQLAAYTHASTRLQRVRDFSPVKTHALMHQANGQKILGIDIGGKKIAASLLYIEDGQIKTAQEETPLRSDNGIGYLDYLKRLSDTYSQHKDLLIGISFAGNINGSQIRSGTNVSQLIADLNRESIIDLRALFPNVTHIDGANDAVTGLIASTLEAYKINKNTKRVLYIINGGGLGGAIWDKNPSQLIAAEPGHIPLIEPLNPQKTTKICHLDGPCIEDVAASGAGVEYIYNMITSHPLHGEEISKLAQQGDPLALSLYDNAALATAAAIVGLDHATGNPSLIPTDISETILICHGGTFKIRGFGKRVEQILERNLGYYPSVIYTEDFTKITSGNACLDGATILALLSHQH